MNCSVHHDVPAVAQCNECGRGLCNNCADAYDAPICERCVSTAVSVNKADTRKQILLAGALFVFGTFIGTGLAHTPGVPPPFPPLITGLVMGVMIAGIPTGWRTLTNLTPRVFLILPLVGWFFYFLFKFCTAWVIGAFILPFKMGTWSAELFRQKRLKFAFPLVCYLLLFTALLLSKSQTPPPRPGAPAAVVKQPESGHPMPASTHQAKAPLTNEERLEHQLVREAQRYYTDQRFKEALSACNEALALNAEDTDAIALKSKIVNAQNAASPTASLGSANDGAGTGVSLETLDAPAVPEICSQLDSAGGQVVLQPAEYSAFTRATAEANSSAQAEALQSFVRSFPRSSVRNKAICRIIDIYRRSGKVDKEQQAIRLLDQPVF